MRFKPNDQFDATLAFLYDSKQTDSLPNYEPVLQTPQNPRTANQYQLQPASTNYSLASLEASWDFGPAVLHSITGWIDRKHSSSVGLCRHHLWRTRRRRHCAAANSRSGYIRR